MQKIISHYEIEETDDVNEHRYQEAESIIKIPIFKNEEKRIEVFEKKTSIEETEAEEIEAEAEPEEPPPPPEPVEPVLKLIRNEDGIVLGIEVHCGCGEKILIKMEY